jgi:hypothetical protein
MTLPYFIATERSTVKLFELDDGRFQLISQGPVGPFSYGYKYLLVENALAEYLQSLSLTRVSYEPAVLFNRSKQKEYRTHTRVKVGQFFRAEEVQDIALDGMRLLSMGDEYFFASPTLKQALEASDFKYLTFTEGLSGFAASAA